MTAASTQTDIHKALENVVEIEHYKSFDQSRGADREDRWRVRVGPLTGQWCYVWTKARCQADQIIDLIERELSK